ncbi:MAG: hypothetical protein WA908_12795 [Pontixanthobacter sp.]
MIDAVVEKSPVRFIDYDATRFDFAALLRERIDADDLTMLTIDSAGKEGWSIYKVMEQSWSYREWWELTETPVFIDLYAAFVREVVIPVFDEPVLVQSCPTPRIVYANQSGSPRFHKDVDYGHSENETNFQVALTPCFATNAMWLEDSAGSADYRPIEYDVGTMAMFDGANLSHGAMPNDTGRSRVSFDFRAIAVKHAEESHRAGPNFQGGPSRGAHVFTCFA